MAIEKNKTEWTYSFFGNTTLQRQSHRVYPEAACAFHINRNIASARRLTQVLDRLELTIAYVSFAGMLPAGS